MSKNEGNQKLKFWRGMPQYINIIINKSLVSLDVIYAIIENFNELIKIVNYWKIEIIFPLNSLTNWW